MNQAQMKAATELAAAAGHRRMREEKVKEVQETLAVAHKAVEQLVRELVDAENDASRAAAWHRKAEEAEFAAR